MTPTQTEEELRMLMYKIHNLRELAGLLSTQDMTKEHPEHALMFLQRAYELGIVSAQQEIERVNKETLIDFAYYCKLQDEQYGRNEKRSTYADEYLQYKQAEGK